MEKTSARFAVQDLSLIHIYSISAIDGSSYQEIHIPAEIFGGDGFERQRRFAIEMCIRDSIQSRTAVCR